MNWINTFTNPLTILYLVVIYLLIAASWWLYQHINKIEASHKQQEALNKTLDPEAYQEEDTLENNLLKSYNWGVEESEPESAILKGIKTIGNFLAMGIWIVFYTCKNMLTEMLFGKGY